MILGYDIALGYADYCFLQSAGSIGLVAYFLYCVYLWFTHKVVSVHDGDTIEIEIGWFIKKKINIRLKDIDAPELKQKHGPQAAKFLQWLLKGQRVFVSFDKTSKGKSYERSVACVSLYGIDIAFVMVLLGHAEDCHEYSKGKYRRAQGFAQFWKLGMWSDENWTRPTDFRHKGTVRKAS